MATLTTYEGASVLVDDEDWVEFASFDLRLTHGYVTYNYKGKKIYLHKSIYYNIDPTYIGIVDHRDREKLNCRRDNLRSATKSQNAINQKIRSTNSSGITGIHWCKKDSRWVVKLRIQGQRVFIGNFVTLEEAIKARQEAAQEYHGDFQGEGF